MSTRRSFLVLLFVLFALFSSAVVPSARADVVTNYTINFTTASGIAPTSGSFSYDSTTPLFSNFVVIWDGQTFDLSASANAPFAGTAPYAGPTNCTGEAATAAYAFAIMSQNVTGCSAQYYWNINSLGGSFVFVVVPSANPSHADEIGSSTTNPTIQLAAGDWTISTVVATPEPATLVMLAGGLLGLLTLARRNLAST